MIIAAIIMNLSFNTASGKYCCNVKDERGVVIERSHVSIPQAVSTVATILILVTMYLTINTKVSIPQAVSTVATLEFMEEYSDDNASFNTASGKYCCNSRV